MSRRFSSAMLTLLLCLTCLGATLSVVSAGPNAAPRQPLPPGAVRGVVTRGAAMRTFPSRSAPIMHHVEQGLSIAVFSMQDGFYAMQLRNGRQGWVPVNAVRIASPLPVHAFNIH